MLESVALVKGCSASGDVKTVLLDFQLTLEDGMGVCILCHIYQNHEDTLDIGLDKYVCLGKWINVYIPVGTSNGSLDN